MVISNPLNVPFCSLQKCQQNKQTKKHEVFHTKPRVPNYLLKKNWLVKKKDLKVVVNELYTSLKTNKQHNNAAFLQHKKWLLGMFFFRFFGRENAAFGVGVGHLEGVHVAPGLEDLQY